MEICTFKVFFPNGYNFLLMRIINTYPFLVTSIYSFTWNWGSLLCTYSITLVFLHDPYVVIITEW